MSKKNKRKLQKRQQGKPKSALSANNIRRNYSGITKPQAKGQPRHSASSSAGAAAAAAIGSSSSSSSKSHQKPKPPAPPALQASQQGQSVPFTRGQKILLVGEGDFSFARSLATHHRCCGSGSGNSNGVGNGPGHPLLVATTLETPASLAAKHPSGRAAANVVALERAGARVLYSIDATALLHPTRGGGARLRRLGPWDRVVFNFPHVGGLTRDVNRQVRANQELCAGFLRSVVNGGITTTGGGGGGNGNGSTASVLAPGGRVVVTLFDGAPYELWGIRNLARHVGLAVDRSAAFEWHRYPGYTHARTLGDVEGGGGWKGEDRPARMYIFARPGEEDRFAKKKRRKRRGSLGSDESEIDTDNDYDEYDHEEGGGDYGSPEPSGDEKEEGGELDDGSDKGESNNERVGDENVADNDDLGNKDSASESNGSEEND